MQTVIDQNARLIGSYIPNILAAVLILIVGWIVATVVSGIVRGLLRKTTLDNRVARWMGGTGLKSEDLIARIIFWLIMLFVLVGFFQALALTVITEPLNLLLAQVLAFLPRLAGAAVLLLVAWIVATILKRIVTTVLGSTGIDRRLGSMVADSEEPSSSSPATMGGAGDDSTQVIMPGGVRAEAQQRAGGGVSLSQTLGEVVYWLVFLLFLPAILGTLALEGVLGPVQTMLDRLLGFLPNIFAAALILLVGWFVARIVQKIVSSLLAALGVDRLGERVGLSRVLGGQTLSGLIGMVVYVLILIPVLISALNSLALEAVTRPASNMLNTILAAIPNIFAAVVLLLIAYVVGRIVSGLVANLLAGFGFDSLPARLGLSQSMATTGRRTPSRIVGTLVMLAIMLFAATEALRLLNFLTLAELMEQFLVLAGQVILGLIIFALGLWLANLAADMVESSGAAQAGVLAMAARVSILVLAGAMALRQMGLANEIVNLAFGLLLGSVAVAVALAFGFGGREIASRELERLVQSLRSRRSAITPPPSPPSPPSI